MLSGLGFSFWLKSFDLPYLPLSGQAFVIFKTKDAAERVIRKLNDGCLMLPNRRYRCRFMYS